MLPAHAGRVVSSLRNWGQLLSRTFICSSSCASSIARICASNPQEAAALFASKKINMFRQNQAMLVNGAQIRAARALLGWSQRDLARAADVHVNAVRYWERQPCLSLRFIESSSPGAKRIISAIFTAGVELAYDPIAVSINPAHHGKPKRSVLRRRAN